MTDCLSLKFSCKNEQSDASRRQPLFLEFSNDSTNDKCISSTKDFAEIRVNGRYRMISKYEGAIVENSCATMRPLLPSKTLLGDKPTMKFIDLSAADNVIGSRRKENSGTKCSKLSSIVAESTEIFEHQYDEMLKTGVPAAGLKHKANNVVGSVISDAFLVAGDETDKSCLYLLP